MGSRSHPRSHAAHKKSGGDIIDIGSVSAPVREPGTEIYVATKAALQAFSESLRKTSHPMNVRVALVEPGLVSNDLVPIAGEEHPKKSPQERCYARNTSPTRRASS